MTLTVLTSDCSQCAALCCVGLSLDKGPLFSFDKAAGAPCPNLNGHACAKHAQLVDIGNKGCVLYDCAGAGQRVVQERFNGESWRDDPTLLPAMLRDFERLKPLHERLKQLEEAGNLELPDILETERQRLMRKCARLWADTEKLQNDYDAFLEAIAAI